MTGNLVRLCLICSLVFVIGPTCEVQENPPAGAADVSCAFTETPFPAVTSVFLTFRDLQANPAEATCSPKPIAAVNGTVCEIEEETLPGNSNVYSLPTTVEGCGAEESNVGKVSFSASSCTRTGGTYSGCRLGVDVGDLHLNLATECELTADSITCTADPGDVCEADTGEGVELRMVFFATLVPGLNPDDISSVDDLHEVNGQSGVALVRDFGGVNEIFYRGDIRNQTPGPDRTFYASSNCDLAVTCDPASGIELTTNSTFDIGTTGFFCGEDPAGGNVRVVQIDAGLADAGPQVAGQTVSATESYNVLIPQGFLSLSHAPAGEIPGVLSVTLDIVINNPGDDIARGNLIFRDAMTGESREVTIDQTTSSRHTWRVPARSSRRYQVSSEGEPAVAAVIVETLAAVTASTTFNTQVGDDLFSAGLGAGEFGLRHVGPIQSDGNATDTAYAVANPTPFPATVEVRLRQGGEVIAEDVIELGPYQQTAQFWHEMVGVPPGALEDASIEFDSHTTITVIALVTINGFQAFSLPVGSR